MHWYTSMVGKKATLRAVRRALAELRCPAVRTTKLRQGRTLQWAVARSCGQSNCFLLPELLIMSYVYCFTMPVDIRLASFAYPEKR